MIILLSSTRPAKVEGAREAIAAIGALDARFAGAELRPHDLGAVGPAMPMDEAAILDGARLRADALASRAGGLPEPWFAVGLEGGLDLAVVGGRRQWTLRTWACVTDGCRWSYGAGGVVPVPHTVAEAVAAGHELGDVIDRLAGAGTRGGRGAWGVLTRDLISRRDAFRIAVIAAFAPFYNPAAFDSAANHA